MRLLTPAFVSLFFCSCAFISTPVKVAGSAASAAIGVTGKAVGAGVSHLGKDKEEEN